MHTCEPDEPVCAGAGLALLVPLLPLVGPEGGGLLPELLPPPPVTYGEGEE